MLKQLILLFVLYSTLIVRAQSNFAAGFNGNINFPNGTFTEYFGTGYGGDAHFLYLLGNSTILSLSVGYNRFDLDVDAFNAKAKELGLNVNFDVESSFSTFPVLLGAKWYFVATKRHGLYAMLEAGLYNYQFKLKGTASSIEPAGFSVPEEIPEVDENGTGTMLRISAGYIYTFARHWFLDASINYIVLTDAFTVDVPDDPEEAEAITGAAETLNYLSISAGLNYRF